MADYDLLLQLRNVPPARIRALPAGKLALVSDEGLAGVSIPIAVYLLQTAGARFLIDCGLGPRWRGTGVTEAPLDEGPRPGLRYRPVLDGPSLAAQLASSDFNPDRVVCTHLHLDHAGGARELGLAVETSEAELDAAFRPGAERDGYAQADLEALPLKVIELRADQPVGPFPASRELAPGVLAVEIEREMLAEIALPNSRVPMEIDLLGLENPVGERRDIAASELRPKAFDEPRIGIARAAWNR